MFHLYIIYFIHVFTIGLLWFHYTRCWFYYIRCFLHYIWFKLCLVLTSLYSVLTSLYLVLSSIWSSPVFFQAVSIKHGLRTTDFELRTGYKTRTKHYGLGIKYGLRYKMRTEHYGPCCCPCGILKRRTKLCVAFSCKVSISSNTRRFNSVENIHNHKVISPWDQVIFARETEAII